MIRTDSYYAPGPHLNTWVFSSRCKVTSYVRLTEFHWQSVPKPCSGNSEAPVTEPGVRPRYDMCVDIKD